MTVRPLDWRDLPILLRYRNDGLFFDSVHRLTRGTALAPAGTLLSYLALATGLFTYLSFEDEDGDLPLIGQVTHPSGSSFARLAFLTPKAALSSAALPALLEYMIVKTGERGAFYMIAETDEQTTAFEALRRAGFAVYARQRIWQLIDQPEGESEVVAWQAARGRDANAVQCLYNTLVPGLVQQVEPSPADNLRGVVYYEGDELVAYVEIRHGARGIWAQPFIHPDAEGITARLGDLLRNLPNRRSRPVYVCVRSYQSWLESTMEDLGAEVSLIQAVMVKHLAVSKRLVRSFALRPLESGQPEPTAPFVRSENNHPS